MIVIDIRIRMKLSCYLGEAFEQVWIGVNRKRYPLPSRGTFGYIIYMFEILGVYVVYFSYLFVCLFICIYVGITHGFFSLLQLAAKNENELRKEIRVHSSHIFKLRKI